MSFISSDIGGAAGILGGSSTYGIDDFYLQVFYPALKGMGLPLIFNSTETKAAEITNYIDILKKYLDDHPEELVVTLSSITDPVLIQQLVNGIKDKGITTDHHKLFYLQGGILTTEITSITDATFIANNVGNVAFRGYDLVLDNDDSNVYKELIYDQSNTKSVSIETYQYIYKYYHFYE